MPRGDGKGPMGAGAMAGRSGSYCRQSPTAGSDNTMTGRGLGAGSRRNCPARGQGQGSGGGRRGQRNMFQATGIPGRMNLGGGSPQAQVNPETEKDILKNQAKALQEQMDLLKIRLDALETATTVE